MGSTEKLNSPTKKNITCCSTQILQTWGRPPHLDGGEGLEHHASQLALLLSRAGHNRGAGRRQLRGRGACGHRRPAGPRKRRVWPACTAARTRQGHGSQDRDGLVENSSGGGGVAAAASRVQAASRARLVGRDASRCGPIEGAGACRAHASPCPRPHAPGRKGRWRDQAARTISHDTRRGLLTGSLRRQHC